MGDWAPGPNAGWQHTGGAKTAARAEVLRNDTGGMKKALAEAGISARVQSAKSPGGRSHLDVFLPASIRKSPERLAEARKIIEHHTGRSDPRTQLQGGSGKMVVGNHTYAIGEMHEG